INNNILTLGGMRYFAARRQQPPGNDMRSVLSSLGQAGFKRFYGGRQYEDAYGLWIVLAHLACALPVDLKQYVFTLMQGFVDAIAWRAIVIAVNFRPFQQGILLEQLFELLAADKS